MKELQLSSYKEANVVEPRWAGQAGNGEWICRALRSLQGLWLVLCVKWRVTEESEKNDMTGFPFQKDHLGSLLRMN